MNDEIMFTIGDDGVAREYKDDYDITIHCESQEEQELAWESLTRRWIPCSERLPEEGVVVVTVDKDGDYEINAIIDEEDGEWFWEKPVAWMPLPKPYERKEE